MDRAVDTHFEVLQRALDEHDGTLVKSTGDGVFATFRRPTNAVRAAADVQRVVDATTWPVDLRIRMGLNTGECIARGGDLYGRAVNKAARLEQAAYGGQVLLSDSTAALVRGDLDDDLSLVYLGKHHFDGIVEPAEVHQLSIRGLRNEHPPLRTLDLGLERLPLELTPLIGRSDATTVLEAELRRTRVVSLVGPAGVGKSRLALRVGSEDARLRASGVRFIDLAPCRQVDATVGTIANALGVRPDAGEGTYAESIIRSLRANDTLLILDNCEHLLAELVPLIELIVSRCPLVTVLTTSRERLDLPYEVVWPVRALDLPPAHATSVAQLGDAGSVQLLVDRARAVTADFAVTDADVPSIVEICRRCDGLPLALELAAARLETMSPRELVTAMASSLSVLGQDGDRAPVGRHGGLGEALDATYGAMSEPEQGLFDRLAVFAGAVPAAAVASVCGEEEPTTRAQLDALVRRSMVTVEREGGWTRFRLLESVRQYALEHGRVDDVLHDRHAAHFVAEAELRGRQYLTAEAFEAARAMEEHFDDFRLAVQWLRGADAPLEAARIVVAINEFCMFSMRPELHTWALELEGELPAGHPRLAEVQGVLAIGWWFRGNHKAALEVGERALASAAAADGPVSTIWAHTALLNAHGHIGDLDKAVEHLMALSSECEATGDPYWRVNALASQAVGLSTVGLGEQALAPAAAAVRIADRLGNPECQYWSAYAEALALRGTDLDASAAALDRALAAARSNASRFNEGIVMLEQLGILVERGRTAAAAVTALDLLDHGEQSGGFGRIWLAVVLASRALADVGRNEAAAVLFAASSRRPMVPNPHVVQLIDGLQEVLGERLGRGAMRQAENRARFLTDSQVLERCREELEAVLRP